MPGGRALTTVAAYSADVPVDVARPFRPCGFIQHLLVDASSIVPVARGGPSAGYLALAFLQPCGHESQARSESLCPPVIPLRKHQLTTDQDCRGPCVGDPTQCVRLPKQPVVEVFRTGTVTRSAV